ncbi:S-layer homology domain-containing protein [Paenibacillus tengchongensis]|uniref:S-layer homology domain-containing protein n=1 Tax=Paenibacillus tengchongensis TaxID=2608684 RepID=UPI00124EA23F|nr:S-layer homology domain-containing protein [Paenibacillus tengchongensis]
MKKHYMHMKSTALGLAFLLIVAMFGSALAPAGQADAAEAAAAPAKVSVSEAVYSAAEYILGGGVQSDWQAIGLVKAGYKADASYLDKLEAKVKEAKGTFTRATDTARTVLAVKALGADPEQFGGYNLIAKLYSHDKIAGQTLNNAVYALLALDSGSYSIPDSAAWTKAKLLGEILAKQNTDGGFALTGGASDPDMTAMALTALAAHKDDAKAVSAGERAAAWLSSALDAGGGYGDSSESVAQAIIALSSFGIDPTGAEYAKDGTELVGKLLSYRNADGGFAHNTGGSSNTLSTEQALLALAAFGSFGQNGGKLYDLSHAAAVNPLVRVSVAIEGPEAALGQANVYAGNVLTALERAAQANHLALVNEAGNYVTGIGGVSAGLYGGYDGWMYIVSRGGQWIYPSVGMNDFALQDNDKVLVYYGGDVTQVVDSVAVNPQKPKPGEAFTLTVTQKQWVWNADTFTSDPVTSPAAGVQVSVGGQRVTTDAYGLATFSGGLAAGRYTLDITGYDNGKAPSLVRYTGELGVSSGAAFADEKRISAWALEAVRSAADAGLIQGVSEETQVFAPKEYITRAQFAALLLRLTGQEPAAASSAQTFSDVLPGAWYYGAVNKAKELGYISGNGSLFNPDGVITRQDMAVMIAKAFDLAGNGAAAFSFSDGGKISPYAVEAVSAVTALGYMSAAGGAFEPAAYVTREMAAVVAVRLP